MDRYREMSVFVRVVDGGSFSAAARALATTPSAVNKQISRLEERLGVQLVQRSTRGLRLTDAGEAYYGAAARILLDISATERLVTRAHEKPQSAFRISSTVALARRIIVPALPEFTATHPNARVELLTTNTIVDLLEAEVDVAVRATTLASSSLVARKLVSDVRVIAAAPEYLARHGMPRVPQDLVHHNCLRLATTPQMSDWPFVGAGGQFTVTVTGNLVSDASDALLQAALDGLGVIRLSMFMLGPRIASGELVPILADAIQQTDTGVYVVYVRSRFLSPLIRSFIDIVARRLGDGSFSAPDVAA